MRTTALPTSSVTKMAVLAAALAGGLGLSSLDAGPAVATPSRARECTACHGPGSVGGTVTARPSAATLAPGGSYTVAIAPPQNRNGGQAGFWIANSNAAGATGSSTGVTGGPSSVATFTARMTAPATPGTYFYKVWAVHGPDDASGVTNFAGYQITVVAAAPVSRPQVVRLSPPRGAAGTSVTITGRRFGRPGVVTFGPRRARVTSWRTARIVVRVPARRGARRRVRVTVTPQGGSASNVAIFTWT